MIIRRRNREKGSTLLLIGWILGIMGVIATFLVYRAEVEWAAVSAWEIRERMQEIAEQQLGERLALLAGDDTPSDSPGDAWYGGNGRIALNQNGCRMILLIEDEGAKPNLNCLKEAALKELAADADIRIDPILDWRDSNDDPVSDSGAENAYYGSLTPPFQARNGFFSSLEELKQLKDGRRLYDLIAPEATVFGRIDPNLLDEEGMRSLLVSLGFAKTRAEMIAADFQNKHRTKRFTALTDFEPLNGMDILRLHVLKPYLQFSAVCNLNFMSRKGLAALLTDCGLDKGKAKTLIQARSQEPFTDIAQISGLLGLPAGTNGQPLAAADCFTVVSTVFRIRVWVVRDGATYYLETVQQRRPAGRGWRVEPLTWKVLLNQEAPAVPAEESANTEESLLP